MNKKQRFYPWLVTIAMGLIMSAIVDTYSGVIGVFLTPIANGMKVKLSDVSFFYTVLGLVMAVTIPFVEKIIKKFNLSIELLGVVIITAFSAFIISNAKNLVIFYIMAGILGICMAFGGLVVQGIVINNWFEKSRNLAFSISSVIESIFLVIVTPITSLLIQKFNWKVAFFVLAIMTLVLGIPSALIVKLKPESLGMLPYGASEEKVASINDSEKHTVKKSISTKALIFSGAFVISVLFTILVQFPGNIIQLFPTYGVSTGIGATAGALMVSVVSFAGIIIVPIIGWSCDKFGPQKALTFWLATGIVAFLVLCWATKAKSKDISLFGSLLICAAYNLFGSGQEIFARYMFEDEFDQGFSLVTSVSYFVGSFIMPILTGILEMTNSFVAVYLFCGLTTIIMIFLVIIGKKYRINAKG